MKLRKILVAHPWVASGGSEATTMWALRALQDDFDVTLVTAGSVDFDALNDTFGCDINPDKLKIINAPVLPGVKHGNHFVAWQHAWFHRFCRKIAANYDLCISGYNIIPFNRQAIQLIGDFSFTEELRTRFYVQDYQKLAHRASPLRSAYLGMKDFISGCKFEAGEKDIILANSKWTAARMHEHLDLDCGVLYPPVALPSETTKHEGRNDHGFLYIGRVSPEKEIEKIITILDGVHARGFPVSLDIAGNSKQSPYEHMISEMANERVWINDLGYLSGEKKEQAFSRNSFGIQACQCEAFGIAAAEMASRGCIPFVAAGCGPAEVAPFEELQFQSSEDATSKIVRLLETPPLTGYLRQKVVENAQRFSAAEFVVNLRGFVESMLPKGSSSSISTNGTKKPSPATHQRSGFLSEKDS